MSNYNVAIGQRYQKQDATVGLWEIVAVLPGADDIAHVRLARVGEKSVVKTVSVAALMDRRMFRLVAS